MDVAVLKKHPAAARAEGFTLIEALVAVLILGLIALSVLGLFSSSTQLNASGIDYTTLTNVAKDQLERLVGMPYFDPADPLNTGYPLAPGVHSRDVPEVFLRVTWRVTEHSVIAGATDPATIFGADPVNTSTVTQMNEGNVKFLTVTVTSTRTQLLGKREVTVQGVKLRES